MKKFSLLLIAINIAIISFAEGSYYAESIRGLEDQPLLAAGPANTSRQELEQNWQPFCLEC